MKIEWDETEQRVIGSLIEKQITTPDQYPLSLNALTNACNQKSNRDPMMNLDEATVQRTLDSLSKKHWVVERSGFGSRVPKYQHRVCNTEYGTLKFSEQELAILCELLLRGPQTPGELRTRASRMATLSDVSEVEAALNTLATRDDGPFVVRLARQPGRRDSQWAHLFGATKPTNVDIESHSAAHVSSGSYSAGHPSADSPSTTHASGAAHASAPASATQFASAERVAQLEQEVQALRVEVEELKQLVLNS